MPTHFGEWSTDHRSIRRRIREFVIPAWLTVPLMFLGLVFLSLPFIPLNGWFDYFLAIAVAIVLAVWSHSRYRVEIQRPADGLYLKRAEDRKHYAPADEI